VIILADDRQSLHIKASLLEFLQSFLGLGVASINGYNRVLFIQHFLSPF